ncbi:hypothetical protein TorRG33x02_248030 [Trema orientale]|uniref:Uncharacterized protein n=1 Tax=Trema orientale TaxID=63057 RepID=A0A2P5DL64_TREOI|nr:hypothetical protein TorRG33x02_248030 [Trema orientale]
MRPHPPLHSNFFSSLKQVEKRLKLEHQSQSSTPDSSEESLSSPIYLHLDHPNDNQNSCTLSESSELPHAFLSCSPQFPPTHQNPLHSNGLDLPRPITEPQLDPVDDIKRLFQLLGLSQNCQKRQQEKEEEDSCHCESGFYSKIAKVKGPKCGKEVERLEGWIEYFLNGGNGEESIEPFRLSLLLLGKAAFVSQGGDVGFGGLEFPSTIEDFLHTDPPPT